MKIGKVIRIIREAPKPIRVTTWPRPKPIPVPDWVKQPEKVEAR